MPANRRPGERACDRLSADGSPSAGAAERPRIFILSDVRLYREGIAVTLGQTNAVDVLGAGAPPDSFARVAQLLPDVVVLDSSLDDALSLPRRMREVVPGVKIVAFAVSGVDQDVIACAEAGISAFVPRDGTIEDLVSAVHQAMHGEFVCSPRITALLLNRVAALSAGHAKPLDGQVLTQREREIVLLVEHGLSNKEIARKLSVSTATVKNHVHNILEKLQLSRRAEVAARMHPSWGYVSFRPLEEVGDNVR
jgi:DNA-binding NarL/FixJ family response regulator